MSTKLQSQLRKKVSQEEYLKQFNWILDNPTYQDRQKLEEMSLLATKIEIATETELFNEFLHSKKGE